jgi:hypothetical protein
LPAALLCLLDLLHAGVPEIICLNVVLCVAKPKLIVVITIILILMLVITTAGSLVLHVNPMYRLNTCDQGGECF